MPFGSAPRHAHLNPQVQARDLVRRPLPSVPADVALVLKLVPILDRQDPDAAARLLASLEAPVAVVSFPARSLGGHRSGRAATSRRRLAELAASARAEVAGEASVPNELVFVLRLRG